jgi:3-mercaptopyruvate sulfurtransferase SseA
MEDNGFKKIYILKGGYRDWNKTKEEIDAEEKARAKELKEREPDTIVIQK